MPMRKFHGMVFLLFAAGAVLTFLCFRAARHYERANVEAEFNLLAQDRAESFEKEVTNNIGVLYSVVSFFDASQRVDREEFRKFTDYVFSWQKDILSITWAPRIMDAERASFEQGMRAEGYPDFQIMEMDSAGNIQPSERRDEYFPNYYSEPFEPNRSIFGLDTASEPLRREAQARAVRLAGPAASDWLHLAGRRGLGYGCRIYAPLYRKAGDGSPGLRTPENLEGFVSLNFEIAKTAEIGWQKLAPRGINTFIFEKSSQETPKVIGFYNLIRQSEAWVQENLRRPSELRWSRTFEFADRQWEVVMMPGESYEKVLIGRRMRPLLVLAAGLFLSFLVSLYFGELLGRNARIEHQVRERTAELSDANKALEMEIVMRRQTEQELLKANEKLSGLNDLKSSFVANVAHELKNPLAVIREAFSLVREDIGETLSADHREFLEIGEKSANRLIRLVVDLLDLSKIEAGKMKLSIELLDMKNLVLDVVRTYERELEKKGLVLHASGIEPVGALWGDADKLTEVVINLLSNAIKYTPSGSITIRLTGDEREIRFEITDTGSGIPPEYLDKVFDKFERVLAEKQEGTGLGLPIARDIVLLHKGKIWVVSEMGKGSSFIFTLPRDCRQNSSPAVP